MLENVKFQGQKSPPHQCLMWQMRRERELAMWRVTNVNWECEISETVIRHHRRVDQAIIRHYTTGSWGKLAGETERGLSGSESRAWPVLTHWTGGLWVIHNLFDNLKSGVSVSRGGPRHQGSGVGQSLYIRSLNSSLREGNEASLVLRGKKSVSV